MPCANMTNDKEEAFQLICLSKDIMSNQSYNISDLLRIGGRISYKIHCRVFQ